MISIFKTLPGFTAIAFILLALAPSTQAMDTAAREAVIMDYASGDILLDKNSLEKMPPSSMSKLMTLYVMFDRLKRGKLKLEDKFHVSEKAWKMEGSRMYLQVDTDVKVEDIIRGIIVQSGNDACVTAAEGIAGTEEEFVKLMNEMAGDIGLKASHFMNSTGLPDDNHYMTAADIATLSKRLIDDFPEYYPYFSEVSFTYNGITQPNRNLLLNKDIGVDGLKTGHTSVAGYGVAVSGVKNNMRLIVVVNGLSSMAERALEAERLLHYGFSQFERVETLAANQIATKIPVHMGAESSVPAIVAKSLTVTVPKSSSAMTVKAIYDAPVKAPVKQGDVIGKAVVLSGDRQWSQNLIAAEDVERKSGISWFLANISDNFNHIFSRD